MNALESMLESQHRKAVESACELCLARLEGSQHLAMTAAARRSADAWESSCPAASCRAAALPEPALGKSKPWNASGEKTFPEACRTSASAAAAAAASDLTRSPIEATSCMHDATH